MKLEQLRLDMVRALLAQAGRPVPELKSGTEAAYVQTLLDELCALSSRDALTGLANRRSFQLALGQELDRVARSGDSALLMIVDIDHFKQINDTLGHLAGDVVIRAVSQALVESVRPMDTVARFGGEEFAVILPSCPPAFAPVVGERIRARVEQLRIDVHGARPVRVTVSCGGAFAPPWVRSVSDVWIERADEQMYQAKESGRNMVCIEPYPVSDVSAEEKDMLFGLGIDNAYMMDGSAATDAAN